MLYSHKPILESLFIFTLFLLSITKAASDELPQQVTQPLRFLPCPAVIAAASNELPQQVNQQQTQIMEANEKIAALASDQQRTARTIDTLQTRLNTAHQEISDLKDSGVFEHNQLVASDAGTQRSANGHGRGGR